MEKEFIPYVLSKQVKQLGFNEECFGYYVDVEVANPFLVIRRISNTQGGYFTLAPLYQQAFRWFREKYNIEVTIRPVPKFDIDKSREVVFYIDGIFISTLRFTTDKSYEEAELECLKKLIEIVKQK